MQTEREESSIFIFGENLLRPEMVTGKKRPEAGSQQRHSTHPLVGKAEIQHSTEQSETHELERQNQDTLYQLEFEFDTPTEQQLDLFTDYEAEAARKEEEEAQLHKERKMQQALLSIRGKFGKNAILRGMNLEEGATTRNRNEQIGGHKA